MEWPGLDILIITYNRPREIRLVIDALWTHLVYPGPVTWRIADDGSPADYRAALDADYPQLDLQWTITQRRGWGANANLGLYNCRQDYVLMIEDDYVAKLDWRLDWGVALMQALPTIGLVRYDGLSGHLLDLELREVSTTLGMLQYLRILKSSPWLNIYSNRPHLKHRKFHAFYGTYPEGLTLAETEVQFAARVKHAVSHLAPDLAALENSIVSAVDHIGHSWQGSEADLQVRNVCAF